MFGVSAPQEAHNCRVVTPSFPTRCFLTASHITRARAAVLFRRTLTSEERLVQCATLSGQTFRGGATPRMSRNDTMAAVRPGVAESRV